MKKIMIMGGIVLLVIVFVSWRWSNGNKNQLVFRLAKMEKGTVIQTVNATGIVQPIKLVQVGTQVNGPITKLYVDFNSRVKAGDVVAQVDPATYQARLSQNKASLVRSEAEVDRVNATLVLAEKELVRAQDLAKRDLISQSELDSAVAERDSLLAQLKLAEASVEQSKSTLQISEVDLEYTTIKSPVNGVVISRNVDEGQTVVASFSAQTLFTIATDLKKMMVEASIPEADIGNIIVGQPVRFTVDAYPQIEFSGKVTQIRLSPAVDQNVVTYTVIIDADNPEEKLFPGMTANLICEVARRDDALKIPNAALRFTPDTSLIEPRLEDNSSGNDQPRQPRTGNPNRSPDVHRARVWIQTDQKLLKAVPVVTGITDGSFTELVKGELSEGQEIVIGTMTQSEAAEMVNPFAPVRPGRRR